MRGGFFYFRPPYTVDNPLPECENVQPMDTITVELIVIAILIGLNGFFSLEEHHARDLPGYYQALTTHPHHNYYFGRSEADLTPWLAARDEVLAHPLMRFGPVRSAFLMLLRSLQTTWWRQNGRNKFQYKNDLRSCDRIATV